MWMIMQHETPEDFVIATGEQHTVRDFTEKAFAANGITIRWEGTGLEEKGYDAENRQNAGMCQSGMVPSDRR